MRKVSSLILPALLLASLLAAGCGGSATIDVAGKTYLNSQEQADSRTILFNPDGTFVYSIVTADKTWKTSGTYRIADGKVTLAFNPVGEISEFNGKTVELKIDNKMLADPDGSGWSEL